MIIVTNWFVVRLQHYQREEVAVIEQGASVYSGNDLNIF